jgi:hypothetical protein
VTETPRSDADDALLVSPELALVDPELARRARALLPDIDELSLERPAATRPPEPVPAPSRERAPRRRRWVLLAGGATVAVIAAAVLIVKNRDGTSHVAPQRSAKAPATAVAKTAPARPSVQTFSWVAVPSAKSYEFELLKGSARIFEARSSLPRLKLPVTWVYRSRRMRLVPGTYRWLVRPVLGSKGHAGLGPTIVNARLVVGR